MSLEKDPMYMQLLAEKQRLQVPSSQRWYSFKGLFPKDMLLSILPILGSSGFYWVTQHRWHLRHFALAVAKGLGGIRVPALALVRPQWLFKMARIQLPVLLVMGLMNQNPKIQMPLQLVMGLVDHSPLPHLMLLMLLALVIRKM
jgi:hypothetical protein